VADEFFVDSFAADIGNKFGRLDYAVSCAGVLGDSLRTHETPLSAYNRIMDINLKGTWLASRAALNIMTKQDPLGRPGQRGAIVNIASQLGIVARPTAGTSCTSPISEGFSANSKSTLLRFQGGHNQHDQIRCHRLFTGWNTGQLRMPGRHRNSNDNRDIRGRGEDEACGQHCPHGPDGNAQRDRRRRAILMFKPSIFQYAANSAKPLDTY